MKRLIIILSFFLIFLNTVSAIETTKKDYSVQAKDGFNIKASLEYPSKDFRSDNPTVLLLHSLGYTSQWWETLPNNLLEAGYAVLLVDLRGHGKSIYNNKLTKISWAGLTNKAFAKYPDDVLCVIDKINSENDKKDYFQNWAVIGSDIGANTAVLASEQIKVKPKTIVMLSPTINIKGLYIPVKLANLDNTDILSITGTNDFAGENAQNYLKKFAQSNFATYKSEAKSNGMHLLKNDKSLSIFITSWIKQYLN